MLVLIHFKSKDTYIKLLSLLMVVSLLVYAAGMLLRNVFGINPNYALSFQNFIDLPLIILIYLKVTDRKFSVTEFLVCGVYTCFALYNFFFIQKENINSYTLIFKSIIVIIYSLYYFYWLLKKLPTTQLQRLPMFWINSSWIIFFAGNFFLFSFTSYLTHVLNDDLLLYWTLHNVLSIIEAILIIFALWVDLRNIKLPSL